jgi:hypothetical protein
MANGEATSTTAWKEQYTGSFAPIQGNLLPNLVTLLALPDNVHLFSLKARDMTSEELAVRLLHLYEADLEDHPRSKEVWFSFFRILTTWSR